jgi:anaerobic sulfite reductase subunit B
MRDLAGTMTMVPTPYQVVARRVETDDVVTLTLRAAGRPVLEPWRPGQFTMVYAFGIGEVPLSVSGGDGDDIRHTVRAVGPVSRAICSAPVGSVLGLRGPFGVGWPVPADQGVDAVIVAGGIGLAPLRPVVTALLAQHRGGRVVVLIGARTPADLLYTEEYPSWRRAGAQVLITVDRAAAGWTDHVGVVTTLLDQAFRTADAASAVGYVCGPELMMRLTGRALVDRGMAATQVHVSIERDMRCGVAVCGHCQLGPLLLCRDGPVASFEVAQPLFAIREL